jgi:hypothetical protein
MRTKCIAWTLALAAIGLGCERQSDKPVSTPPAAQVAVPAGFILAQEPAGARPLADVKSSAKDGDDVVIRAVIGGSENPFVATRAVVQIIDPGVKTCDQTPGDSCKTPWDACCDQDNVKAKGATLQVVDTAGKPLAGTLQGVGGLKTLSHVVIVGKAKSDGPALLINATGVFVKP